jgi:hypothetical protein
MYPSIRTPLDRSPPASLRSAPARRVRDQNGDGDSGDSGKGHGLTDDTVAPPGQIAANGKEEQVSPSTFWLVGRK